MQLILDANTSSGAMKAGDDCEFPTFIKCLLLGKARLALGGTKQANEYARVAEMQRFVVALDRAGKVARVSSVDVDARMADLESQALMTSDDPHIIALAQIGGARVLCTKDRALMDDFTNSKLISAPRGKIYSGERNNNLLKSVLPKAR